MKTTTKKLTKAIRVSKKRPKKLLSKGSTNFKTEKNEFRTWILYITPADENSEGVNNCPFASKGCLAACLNTAGRGQMGSVQAARRRKADYMVEDRAGFYEQLAKEITNKVKYYQRRNEVIAFRLNGTSDVDHVKALKHYTGLDIKSLHGKAIFYDYTPNIKRAIKYLPHPNYTIAFSKKEDNDHNVDIAMEHGINTAIVFDGPIPKFYKGKRVVDGDKSDMVMVFEDDVVLALKAKGDAKKDTTGFVVRTNTSL